MFLILEPDGYVLSVVAKTTNKIYILSQHYDKIAFVDDISFCGWKSSVPVSATVHKQNYEDEEGVN